MVLCGAGQRLKVGALGGQNIAGAGLSRAQCVDRMDGRCCGLAALSSRSREGDGAWPGCGGSSVPHEEGACWLGDI